MYAQLLEADMLDKYSVGGMSCAACSARVEKAVSAVEGVKSCSVNLLTNSMVVEGTADKATIINAVEKAGYTAAKANEKNTSNNDDLVDKTTPKLIKRLVFSIIFLIVLMYFSMGHTMWGLPLPSFFEHNHIAIGITQMLLCVIVMIINQSFFTNGFKALFKRSPNMDSLIALGSSAGFIYSTYSLFKMTSVSSEVAMSILHNDLYFESSAMILALITIGKTLESFSKGKTTNALKSLMNLQAKTVKIIKDGKEITIPTEQISVGDEFVVYPGESIAVDGVILSGESAIDESSLTGESVPIDKAVDDKVSSGTINKSGFLRCKALKVGEDTTISQIIKMVNDAASSKAPIAKIADKVSGIFVPIVIAIALLTFIGWLIVGQPVNFSLSRAISVLVISCPCALGLATPVAIMVGNGIGAKNGILFKNATALENLGKVNIVALDKTGTITKGEPTVTDIISLSDDLLKIAFSLEKQSEHPLAKAITSYCEQNKTEVFETESFKEIAGNGISAKINNVQYFGGSYKFISKNIEIDNDTEKTISELTSKGKTPLLFANEKQLVGIIAVADTIKQDSPNAIKQLQKMGIKVVMLTGDNKQTANIIAKQSGVDEVFAEVLPDGKKQIIDKLKQNGKVLMVGDGINDAPALSAADSSVAIGAGTDVAVEAADIVIVKSVLSDLVKAITISKLTIRNIHENLFWAFIYNVIGIPLAIGLFINLFGWQLNPMFGAAAMSLSSFCVVTNALRLNLYNLEKKRFFKKNTVKEQDIMEKTVKIEGMMCEHCEAHVKKALENLDEVISAQVSHKDGTAKLNLSKEIDDEAVKQAVENEGYKYIG